jgi:hypothetical protein
MTRVNSRQTFDLTVDLPSFREQPYYLDRLYADAFSLVATKSGSGVFIWPGSLAVVVVVFLLMFVLRRR